MTDDSKQEVLRFLDQVESDLKSAHAEICKLQNLDPQSHTWPEWSPQANTLRWIIPGLREKLDQLIELDARAETAEQEAAALRGQLSEAYERAAKVAETDKELLGEPTDEAFLAMKAYPILNARAACRATKKSIAAAIRSLPLPKDR